MPRKTAPRRRSRLRSYARRAARPVASIAGGLVVANTVGHVLATPGGRNPIASAMDAAKGNGNFGTPVQDIVENIRISAPKIAVPIAGLIIGRAAAKMLGINTTIARVGKYDVRVI